MFVCLVLLFPYTLRSLFDKTTQNFACTNKIFWLCMAAKGDKWVVFLITNQNQLSTLNSNWIQEEIFTNGNSYYNYSGIKSVSRECVCERCLLLKFSGTNSDMRVKCKDVSGKTQIQNLFLLTHIVLQLLYVFATNKYFSWISFVARKTLCKHYKSKWDLFWNRSLWMDEPLSYGSFQYV